MFNILNQYMILIAMLWCGARLRENEPIKRAKTDALCAAVTGLYSLCSPSHALLGRGLGPSGDYPFCIILDVLRGLRPLPRQARKPPTLRFGDYRHGLGTPALRGLSWVLVEGPKPCFEWGN